MAALKSKVVKEEWRLRKMSISNRRHRNNHTGEETKGIDPVGAAGEIEMGIGCGCG